MQMNRACPGRDDRGRIGSQLLGGDGNPRVLVARSPAVQTCLDEHDSTVECAAAAGPAASPVRSPAPPGDASIDVTGVLKPGAVRYRLRSVPAPLAALLGVVLVFGVSWALLVPPPQLPAAPNHRGYAPSLAEPHAVPG